MLAVMYIAENVKPKNVEEVKKKNTTHQLQIFIFFSILVPGCLSAIHIILTMLMMMMVVA
jgi:hypothetical protein